MSAVTPVAVACLGSEDEAGRQDDPRPRISRRAAAGRELRRPRTVQNHLVRIRVKTGSRRRSDLTGWAVTHGIVG
jgi:hypothetical protein